MQKHAKTKAFFITNKNRIKMLGALPVETIMSMNLWTDYM